MSKRATFRAAVYVLPRRDDEILLARRFNTGFGDGYFSLIAGHVEQREFARACAVREVAEEAGITIDPADLVFALSVIPQEGVVGDFFDLVATSRNDGPSDAQDVQIDVNVPLGMQLLTRSPSAGGACADLATAAGTTLTCTWAGATAPGTTHSVNAVVQAVSVGQIRVSGSTSSATADPVADNNAATVTVSAGVLPVPALQPVWLLAMTLLLLGLGGLAVRQRS